MNQMHKRLHVWLIDWIVLCIIVYIVHVLHTNFMHLPNVVFENLKFGTSAMFISHFDFWFVHFTFGKLSRLFIECFSFCFCSCKCNRCSHTILKSESSAVTMYTLAFVIRLFWDIEIVRCQSKDYIIFYNMRRFKCKH